MGEYRFGFDDAVELARKFDEFSRHLHTVPEAGDTLQRLVELATKVLPDCEWAGITEHRPSQRPRTVAASGPVVLLIDQLQYDLEQGPCLQAIHADDLVISADLATEQRWPEFARRAVAESPVRSVMAFRLEGHPQPAALNLYCSTAGAFGRDALAAGAVFATHSHMAMAMAQADAEQRAWEMGKALGSNRSIGVAMGILMNADKLTEDQAWEILRTTSQHLNIKLRDVAVHIAETREVPRAGAG